MEDDSASVRWLLEANSNLTDEEIAGLIGSSRSAIGLWRQKVEAGEPVLIRRMAVRRALLLLWRQAQDRPDDQPHVTRSPAVVIGEIRSRLAELEQLVATPDVAREIAKLSRSSAKQSTDALAPKKPGRKDADQAG